jgi:hypothetical protein
MRSKRCTRQNEHKHNGGKDIVTHVEPASFDCAGDDADVEPSWQLWCRL